MEQAKQSAEAELNVSGPNETLKEFVKRCDVELAQLNESAQITKVRIK